MSPPSVYEMFLRFLVCECHVLVCFRFFLCRGFLIERGCLLVAFGLGSSLVFGGLGVIRVYSF